MLLLLTGSIDGTSDLIVGRLDKRVFRFNFDLFRDYDLSFTPSGWRINNPAGHSISSETVTSVFWWKAFNYYLLEEDKFVAEEVKYLFRELYNWACLRRISKGTPPDFHNRLGKINILEIASKYFRVAATRTFNSASLGISNSSKVRVTALSVALSDLPRASAIC